MGPLHGSPTRYPGLGLFLWPEQDPICIGIARTQAVVGCDTTKNFVGTDPFTALGIRIYWSTMEEESAGDD